MAACMRTDKGAVGWWLDESQQLRKMKTHLLNSMQDDCLATRRNLLSMSFGVVGKEERQA